MSPILGSFLCRIHTIRGLYYLKNKQLDKFKAAAREAECDLDENSFDEALGKLAKSHKSDLKDQQSDDNVEEIEKP